MSTERVRIELTEEQRDDLLRLLLAVGMGIDFLERESQRETARSLRQLIAAAPTVTLPDESEEKE